MSESIESLAKAWLEAERALRTKDGEVGFERRARLASAAYDEAIRVASADELLLAWQAACKAQAVHAVGSAAWLDARSVSELLRTEYEASRTPMSP